MSHGDPDGPRFVRIPLHVLAAAGTTLLLILVAVVLAWSSYRNTREVVSSTVDESIRHASVALRGKVRGILQPAENQLDLLVFSAIVKAATVEQRLASVPMALAVLAANPLLDTWYVGYPDGAFVLFRALRDRALRSVYHAPDDAVLMVQSIGMGRGGVPEGEYFYFDSQGRVLQHRPRPTYRFDPRTRNWYRMALGHRQNVLTEPYLFYTNREVGITLAREASPGVVVGLDATINDIGSELSELRITPGTRVAVIDRGGQLIAVDEPRVTGDRYDDNGELRMAWLEETNVPALTEAQYLPADSVQRQYVTIGKRDWELISLPVPLQTSNQAYRVLMAVPGDELFEKAQSLLMRQWWLILGLIVLSVPVGYWLTQRIVRPLRLLAEETHRVARFDFSALPLRRSRIAEVDMLTTATVQMRSTIARFLDVSAALNSDLRLEHLLEVVLGDLVETTASRNGAIYLFDPDTNLLHRSQAQGTGADEAYERVMELEPAGEGPVMRAAVLRRSVAGDQSGRDAGVFAVPLETLGKEFVGVLVLDLGKPLGPESIARRDPVVAFIEALSSTAAVAIETRRLVESQKALLEAMIQLLAGAIDAKSPYTGGHCQRVPELTRMLAEAAHAEEQGSFSGFRLTPELREAVHVAAWLHDCGKITTPEYVVDKATKLETLFNRIHEIRMRFEVLKRDAEIRFWKGAAASVPDAAARAVLEAEWAQLDEEFAFVAACNHGGESMDDESIRRLQQIAARQWVRTIDDRLGLSNDEMLRCRNTPSAPLPAVECLLADKPEHIEHRAAKELMPANNPWGFRIEVPARKFNRGELYNLAVRRGTLTPEERYIINDHIVQTIMMLDRLPFPRHLRSVPEIAGGHHEKMDGTGYPKRLRGEQMSVPARIMAIADVFEALTAADRPYKSPKTLSESLHIMARMAREQHLDGELFALFVRSGVYREYAGRFLQPAQMDAVDEAALLV
ncbi:HD domain-containing phosphohydrolase [Uliginosibacterium paludis]|uniref:HD domain-containing phosphohydrolase n=1 Tax=Uliginosibacterium paludis TaxID=1615952 RepID=A0ABV2CPU1_9RHOO